MGESRAQDLKMGRQTKLAIGILLLLVAAVACILALPGVWFLIGGVFDETTITFRNDSGRPCSVCATIVDVERNGRRSVHRFELPVRGSHTIQVQHGLKRIRYAVDGKEGEISFDMWHGEDVVLAVDSERTLSQVWDRGD